MKICRVFQCLLGFLLPLVSSPLLAQGPVPQLSKGVDESTRVLLAGSRNPRIASARDLGSVPPDMVLPGITLALRRSPSQEAALQDLLHEQQNTKSSLYHQWLNPESFASRFGVADSDLRAVEQWLASYEFRIEGVARSRDRVTFSGTAAQVRAAFGAELHYYQESGELHFAPATDLRLPANLASATTAILHLSDFRPKPSVKPMTKPKPDFTSAATQVHYLSPKDILTMYNATPLSAKSIWGSGQGVAVVGQSYVYPSSVETFQGYLTQHTAINIVLVPNSGPEAYSPGDQGESEIDLEYSSGIAQNATIFLVYVGANQNYSVFDALAFAIAEDIAPVVSISYGACETLISPSELEQFDALFEQASAQGQTLVASSGDSGSTACAPYGSAQGVTLAQQQGLSVNFPASSPHVTAVGGTQMAPGTFTTGTSPYWANAPSGIDVAGSLLSYVPEVVWNEGSPSHGIIAGGGGTSTYFPRPAWQSSYPGMPAGSYRLVPDIALQSSIADPGFVICTSDPALTYQEGQTVSCGSGLLGDNNQYTIAGGTSFAAPIFAGFLALLNQAENATGQGNINSTLYSLASSPNEYATAFHDIITGSNACIAGSGICVAADESSYAATAGYDEATGLGSLDFNALTEAWPPSSETSLQSTWVSVISSAYTATPGQTLPVQLVVGSLYSPNSPAPTGTSVPTGSVSVSVDNQIVNSSLPFSSTNPDEYYASVSYDFVAPAAAGSHLISVSYPGDSAHAPARAAYAVMVGNVLATGSITLGAADLTVANGSTGSTQVTVTPSDGYNGRLVWSLAVTGTNNLTACYSIASLPVNGISTAKLTIGTGKACANALPSDRPAYKRISPGTLATSTDPRCWTATHSTGLCACLLALGCLARARRKSRLSLFMMIATVLIAGANLTACGGGGSKSGTTTTPPPSTSTTYKLTLTGTDSVNGFINASTTFTLTVH